MRGTPLLHVHVHVHVSQNLRDRKGVESRPIRRGDIASLRIVFTGIEYHG